MENFDLSDNRISIKATTYLAQCLHRVGSLNINKCEFDAVRFEIMAAYLEKTNHTVSNAPKKNNDLL